MTEERESLPPLMHWGSAPTPVDWYGSLNNHFSPWSNDPMPGLIRRNCLDFDDDNGGFTEVVGSGMFPFVCLLWK